MYFILMQECTQKNKMNKYYLTMNKNKSCLDNPNEWNIMMLGSKGILFLTDAMTCIINRFNMLYDRKIVC